jgi:penicillin-binding protein 1C
VSVHFFENLLKIVLATRLEIRYSKNEILSLYYNHAPFGGNVVGVQAASWRFFGRQANNLSWAEAALLAVLPNSPSIIHISKNRQNLTNKRNKLLLKIFNSGKIDKNTYLLSIIEPLPDHPFPLPDLVPHLTNKINARRNADITLSSINFKLQQNIIRIVNDYMAHLHANNISNLGVIVVDVKSSEILSYIGNVPVGKYRVEGQDVDVITAPRSTREYFKADIVFGNVIGRSYVAGNFNSRYTNHNIRV